MHAKPCDRVLVIDSRETNRTIIEEILGSEFLVRTAASSAQALAAAIDFKPDVIVLEASLVSSAGYEVLRQLRADTQLRDAKVVLISAHNQADDRLRGYEAGADDYIAEPFDAAELLAKVRVFARLQSIEGLDAMRSDLLTLLANELSVPLGEIMPVADALLSSRPLTKTQKQALGRVIDDSVSRLTTLTERGLLLCQLRAHRAVAGEQRVNPTELALPAIKTATGNHPHQVRVNCQARDQICAVDAYHLETAIGSLIDGALAWTPVDRAVEVAVGLDDRRGWAVEVSSDTPAGGEPSLPPATTTSRQNPAANHGLGYALGLTLAGELARLYGGDLDLPRQDASGWRSRLWLPLAAP